MSEKTVFEEEKNKLEEVISTIDNRINKSSNKFNDEKHHVIGFTEGLRGTQFNRQAMMSMYATDVNYLKSIRNNPYFGKFLFHEKNGDIKEIYIGKKMLFDEKQGAIVNDWRSDLCSMYYDFNIGEDAYYVEDNDKKEGQIISKRQLYIENAELINVNEQDTLSNDEILIKCLQDNFDARMRTIVATIQKEQNAIIRNSSKSNYIVQGVAGSGKTTVALHRISYLLYNELKENLSSNFMIIGPNKFFLDYISSVLPELDIDDVYQTTFEDIFMANVKTKFRIKNKNEELVENMYDSSIGNCCHYKTSIEYMDLIKRFVDFYIKSKLGEDIKYGNSIIIKKEKMIDLTSDRVTTPYKERVSNYIKKMTKFFKENYDEVYAQLSRPIMTELRLVASNDTTEKQKIIEKMSELRNKIKKGFNDELKQFFSFIDTSPVSIYYSFIENLDVFIQDTNVETIKNTTLNNLENNCISTSDMAAILYIQYLISGCKKYNDYSHLIIDEGQDLSVAQYFILNKLFSNAKFDIYGDINQSIYAYQSISNWDELNKLLFNNNAIYFELNKGYRNTIEISNVSNLILNRLNQISSDSISRSGVEIKSNNIDASDNASLKIEELTELYNNGYKNIAIICKDCEEVELLFRQLKKYNLPMNKIIKDSDKYKTGICVLPAYLSKGLEFDGVIINDASYYKYSDDVIDQRLLYVAVTRALHQLIVDYDKCITPSLSEIINQKNVLKK